MDRYENIGGGMYRVADGAWVKFEDIAPKTCETCGVTPCAIYDVAADADERVHEETFGCIYHKEKV